ncbi:uncharacterized protein MELLADRAFT_123443 [Melampsora larici-populina 98AG31]|uniref:Secreted protein n=1 Tax=Melampsora larici-populina (strain 98AG31 / pathotype 3-4-7) TaxID=747676 RepID=F4RPB7_MELLP|nr:uncharacterized protein MELLADRAFT_123443 [Melampsora larici-populina 98AG31]EGG05876.1 secreted protein [Melampsora larici-populina 98AG31]
MVPEFNKFVYIVLFCSSILASLVIAPFVESSNIRKIFLNQQNNNEEIPETEAWKCILDFYNSLADTSNIGSTAPLSNLNLETFTLRQIVRDGSRPVPIDQKYAAFRRGMDGYSQKLTQVEFVEKIGRKALSVKVRGQFTNDRVQDRQEEISRLHQAVFLVQFFRAKWLVKEVHIIHGPPNMLPVAANYFGYLELTTTHKYRHN